MRQEVDGLASVQAGREAGVVDLSGPICTLGKVNT